MISHWIRRWKESDENQRGRMMLSGASLIGFGMAFVLSPVWSRVYPVEYFSVSALVQVLPGLFAGWCTLAFHDAIHTPESEEDANGLAKVALFSVLAFGAVLAVACLGAGEWVARQIGGDGNVRPWLWASPLLLVFSGATLVLDQLIARRKRFAAMAKAIAVQSLVTPIFPAIGAFQPERTNFIVIGLVAGNAVGLFLRLGFSGLASEMWRLELSASKAVSLMKRHLNFPRDILPGSVLTGFSSQLPILFLARSFGTEMAGHYGRALTLLNLPSVVFGNAFSAVFRQEAGAAYRKRGDCRPVFLRTLGKLLMLMVPIYGVLAVISPWLYPLFYGDSWGEAGRIAQPMAIYYLAATVSAPLSAVLYFGKNTRWDLLWQFVRLPLIFGALWAGCELFGVVAALLTFALSYVVLYVLYLGLAYYFARDHARLKTESRPREGS